ncbi:MAG: flagellar basal body-associated FliL family protein [Gammaproteobacteria bacterium]|nr:flagellar basal body-associated FliL family protein [Gammaproteobacteria bacterium]
MSDEKETEEPKKKGKMPLILGLVAVLGLGGGGGWYYMQTQKKAEEEKKAEAKAESTKEEEKIEEPIKVDMSTRTFVTLEPFTFNLTDTEQDRFGQVKVVFEVANPQVEGEIETVSPAIRNALLLVLTSKTSQELLSTRGKRDLAGEMIDATNAILSGQEPPEIMTAAQREKKRKAMRKLIAQMAKEDPDFELPTSKANNKFPKRVRAAHFSQFIVQ